MALKLRDHQTPGRAGRGLVVVGVVGLLLLQRTAGVRFEAARGAARQLTRPVLWPFRALAGVARRLTGAFGDVSALRAEIRRLKEAASAAELRARLGEEARREADRLREALSVQRAVRDRLPVSPLLAHVTGTSTHPHERRVILDRGASDGVTVDSPVIYGEDVLGRVIQVDASTCVVMLVQDPPSALGVILEDERTPGVAQGTGGELLELSGFPGDTRFAPGARVLTGSLSAYYPKGLVVGLLEETDEGWRVRPRRSPVRLEEAFILPLAPPDPPAATPAPPDS